MKILFFFFISSLAFGQHRSVVIGHQSKLNGVLLSSHPNATQLIPGHFLIEENRIAELESFDYISEFRTIGQQFSYTSNELIIRIKNVNESILDRLSLFGTVKLNEFNNTLITVISSAKNENTMRDYCQQIKNIENVVHVHPNQYFTLNVTSNDPLYPNQWYLENSGTALQFNGTNDADIDIEQAWDLALGDDIIVSVMDSGIDTLHEEFQGRLLPGLDAFATDSINTNGFPFTNYDENAHGTACAGIIGATKDNNIGISGIAPNVKLVPTRMFFYISFNNQILPFTNMSALINASAYSWNVANADVISCSAGLTDEFINLLVIDTAICNQELRMAHENGRNGKGCVLLFSAGNDNIPSVLWPANLPETIAVGASDMCDKRKRPSDCSGETWWGSSYGQTLDLVAPGVKIATCDISGSIGYSTNNYTLSYNGTSAACPIAAGVSALLLDRNSNLTADEVKHILDATAEKVSPYSYDSTTLHGTWNQEVGHGRINAHLALQQAFSASLDSESQEFIVYPNPVKDYLYVSCAHHELKNLSLFNLEGKFVMHVEINQATTIKNLAAGCYYLKSKDTTKKIIVLSH